MNSKEFINEDTNAVITGPSLFSIQTHEENIKKRKKYNEPVGNGFPT